MRKQYDFSNATQNPYVRELKRSLTIRLDAATLAYFRGLAAESGVPYQTLINLYLRDCAQSGRRLVWQKTPAKRTRKTVRPKPAS